MAAQLTEAEGIWSAHDPALPGVYGLGTTEREALDDLAEAATLLREYLAEISEAQPLP